MLKLKNLILVLVIAVFLSGCFIKVSKDPIGSNGGIFVSTDNAKTWQNISRLLSIEPGSNFMGADITTIEFDPQDSSIIYAGTVTNGIYYSLDSGKGWQSTLNGVGKIKDIAISYSSNCSIFAAVNDRIYHTGDCGRNWLAAYTDSQAESFITDIQTDPNNKDVVYAINNLGSLIKSTNNGVSWELVYFFDVALEKVFVKYDDSNTLYIATTNRGIFKSIDKGIAWTNITDGFDKEIKKKNYYRHLVLDPKKPDKLLYINAYGMFVSNNAGVSWDNINLLTPPSSVRIYAASLSQINSDYIYYATRETFYFSADGGQNWITEATPTSKVITNILPSPVHADAIYIGVANINN